MNRDEKLARFPEQAPRWRVQRVPPGVWAATPYRGLIEVKWSPGWDIAQQYADEQARS